MTLAGQLLGLVTLILGLTSFYQTNDRKLILWMLAFTLVNATHFALLGAMTAAIAACIASVRVLAALHLRGWRPALAFVLLTLATTLPSVENGYHLFAIAGSCLGSYSLFMLKGRGLRLGLMAGGLCWLANNIYAGSVGGITLELCLLLMNARTLYVLQSAFKQSETPSVS